MTLEEAQREYDKWHKEAWKQFADDSYSVAQHRSSVAKREAALEVLQFLKSTPTQQLCSVAREIANEKE